MDTLGLLLYVAQQGGLYSGALITTGSAAQRLGASQQSVSLWVAKLEKNGLLDKKSTSRGLIVRLSPKARSLLVAYSNRLAKVLRPRDFVEGTVFSGIGQGRFYTTLPKYRKQFWEKFGIDPFPGTLNLRVDEAELVGFAEGTEKVKIRGFRTSRRSYGSLDCFVVSVHDIRCAALLPERTVHRNTLEIISRVNLRAKLKLSDNSRVTVQHLGGKT